MSAQRRAARAVHDVAKNRASQRQSQYLGEIVDLTPLTVELAESRDVIDEHEGLVMTQWVRKYMLDVGLEVGDDVLVDHRAGHWIVVDVLSDNEVV
jgi:hypothetical protein